MEYTLEEIKQVMKDIQDDGLLVSEDEMVLRLEDLRDQKLDIETQTRRELFLRQHNRQDGDIMEDEGGHEYVMSDEDEEGRMIKLYIK